MKILATNISNRVVIKQSEAESEQDGIIIPDSVQEQPLRGVVVAVSKEYLCPKNGIVVPVVKIGDTVLYEKHTGTSVQYEDEEHIILMEHNIFAVI